MTNLFESQTSDQDLELEAAFEARFKKDDGVNVDELKKAWMHSQKHIKTVEGDNTKLRDDVIKRMSYEDLLEQLKTANASNARQHNDDTEDNGNQNTQNVDIDALVENKLNAKLNQFQQSTIESENRAAVIAELRKAWGDDYVERLKAETSALGKTSDQINAMAGSDPVLLLRALGVDNKVEKKPIINTAAPRSSVSIKSGTRVTSKYEEMRSVMKTDPKKYSSPAYQMEMLRVAEEMGDKFYQKG